MAQTKILTLVVPGYNCASFIHKLIDKIPINQVRDDLELVLIDDGSKDNTWAVFEQLQQTYGADWIKIYHKENGNWGSVHNYAKKLPLSGKFVKTLDSDDYLDPYALIKFIQFLKNLKPDIDLVFSNVNFINNKDEIVDQKFYDKLFKKKYFRIDEIKITKLSVLTVHTFTARTQIYQSIPDLPEKMSYMDSVFNFLLINAAKQECAFFSYAPLYQYLCGVEEQTISVANLSKHSDWIQIMLETEAKYAIQYKMFDTNTKGKCNILGQLIQLGFYHYAYAICNKTELNNKQQSKILLNELQNIKNILGNKYYKKYIRDFALWLINLFKFKFFPSFVKVAVVILNGGYLKATKKDHKRLNVNKKLKRNN